MSRPALQALLVTAAALQAASASGALTKIPRKISPDLRAEKLAWSQPRARETLAKIQAEARRIANPRLRAEALQLLDRPRFTVVRARKKAERQIREKLRKEELLDASPLLALFPAHPSMRFIAAMGDNWNGVHAYPAGLAQHTLLNLTKGLAYANTHRELYGTRLDGDLIRLAAIWGDSAKAMALTWNENGSTAPVESAVTRAFGHRVWAVSEALFRGYSPRLVVTLAAAANPSDNERDRALRNLLKASAIIAGKPYEAAGLTRDGKKLAEIVPLEARAGSLEDRDAALTQEPTQSVAKVLDAALGTRDFWKRDELLSRYGDVAVYTKLIHDGESKTSEWARAAFKK